MTIDINGIPTTTRTPNALAEIDNSRALRGLAQNPHRALLTGQALSDGSGSVANGVLVAISRENLANTYFGAGSELARMCNFYKDNNPNTELYALALSATGGTRASGRIEISDIMGTGASVQASTAGILYLMVCGENIELNAATSAHSATDIASQAMTLINTTTYSHLPVTCSVSAGDLIFNAVNSGTPGNQLDVRMNYYPGQSFPAWVSVGQVSAHSQYVKSFVGGATDPDLDDAWAIVENEQFHYVGHPYPTAANLTSVEDELEDRFGPMVDKWGQALTVHCNTLAELTSLGNARNSFASTIMGVNKPPQGNCEWVGALTGVVAMNINNDPARPLQFLKLKGILPPWTEDQFTQTERNTLLYDGIATYIVDSGGKVLIERCITTFQANALGLPDWSYLDIQTPATLAEIRFQWRTRMANRFIIPRFKLADDSTNIPPGAKVARPKDVRSESIALFSQLEGVLIEDLDDFVKNILVERASNDVNRVNALLPPNLINQFRVLAGLIQFIL